MPSEALNPNPLPAATEATGKETKGDVWDWRLNYEKGHLFYPQYRYTRITNNENNGASQTINTTGGSKMTYTVPPKSVFNLSRSYFESSYTIGASAAFTWVPLDVWLPWQEMHFQDGRKRDIIAISRLDKWTQIASKVYTKFNKYMSLALINISMGLQPCNGTGTNERYDGTNASRPYIEPAYAQPSTNAAAMTLLLRYPLWMLYETICAIDKDLYFGTAMNFILTLNNTNQSTWAGTSGTNPSTGAGAATASVTLSGNYLNLAEEVNPKVIDAIQEAARSGKLSLYIPILTTNTAPISTASTSQAPNIEISNKLGKRLLRIISVPFNYTESSNTSYDHSNVSQAKVVSYQTKWNTKFIQETALSCANADDWEQMGYLFYGSAMIDQSVFMYNWMHIDDWSGSGALCDDPYPQAEKGVELAASVDKYQLIATTANIQIQWYMWTVCQGLLEIHDGYFTIDGS